MRVLTFFGTRPEIIRLSEITKVLDRRCDHVLVHSGQNFDARLSDVFFDELGVRAPDRHLGIRSANFPDQVAQILRIGAEILDEVRPDRLLVLGDTNSGLLALVAARRGIPVFHLEAGNRCYDDRVPEEINRRIIDHCSSVLMPYTHRSKENLLREGFRRERVFVVGNPIYEVLVAQGPSITARDALTRFGVEERAYFLVTVHRAENVDHSARLAAYFEALGRVQREHGIPVLVSLHPRTADRMREFGVRSPGPEVRLLEPLGFLDFVALEKSARCVITDSGTVQEECAIFGVPNVTIRDVTERPETIECGSNMLTGAVPERIQHAVALVTDEGDNWTPPAEYVQRNVAATVARVVLGFHLSLESSQRELGPPADGLESKRNEGL